MLHANKLVACRCKGNLWFSGVVIYTFFFDCIADTGNYLHVHPFFLHSNATSHKWVFGGMF